MNVVSFFDYNCVFCYLGRYRLKEASARVGASIQWIAWRMPNDAAPPPKPADYRQGVKTYVAQAGAALGLEIRLMPSVDTFDAFTGMYYAREMGCEEAYHQQVFDARFLRGLDVSDRSVLAACAETAGLRRDDYLRALDNEVYRERVRADFERAAKERIWTIPSYVLGEQQWQVHHYDQLPTVDELAAWLRSPAGGPSDRSNLGAGGNA
ncbi:MAG: DsbA family protein [Alicyclobacillaceae bacterium]|nr:DsbA family protein [Alicyclobacillaceae bacterium]